MELILLFLFWCFIESSYCLEMTYVSRNLRTSLPTTYSTDKYFYLTNSDYHPHSKYIYICLEDNNSGLSDTIEYCSTNTDPYSYPKKAISDCFFSTIYYYYKTRSSGTIKYYYKISATSSNYYSLFRYEAGYPYGNLYVTSDYNDFIPTIKVTRVPRNSRTSLPTTISEDKYFYLINNDYFNYSSYIYICLEDNNFGLNYNDIKYCMTDTNPYMYSESAISGCSFSSISYYNIQSSSGIIKYYYKIPTSSSYYYSIVYYQGNNSSGYLYATSDYMI